MELPDEDLDNIFDEYESRENEGETNGTGNNEETNNETSAGVRVQPLKRVVKNPRLKFNPERFQWNFNKIITFLLVYLLY